MTEGQVAEQEVLDRKLAGTEIEIAGHSRALDRNPRRSGHPFLEWMVVLAKRKSFILKSVCAAALAALLLVLLLPNAYTANTRVLLSGQDQSMPAELLGSQNLPLVSSLYTSDV
ncbi:MAG TPA: Wzz/FepE/Etk N-terminal domain-containing protein, partial [Candidatus Angelobacter sp.]